MTLSNTIQDTHNQSDFLFTICSIEVGYSETVSLPEYSNAKFSLTVQAGVQPGVDPEAARLALTGQVEQIVHAQVDEALMAEGKRPKHDRGTPFQVLSNNDQKIVAVIPNNNEGTQTLDELTHSRSWFHVYGIERGLSLAWCIKHAEREITNHGAGWTLAICADGNLDPIVNLAAEIKPPKTEVPF